MGETTGQDTTRQETGSEQCGLPTLPEVPEVQVVCPFVCVFVRLCTLGICFLSSLRVGD